MGYTAAVMTGPDAPIETRTLPDPSLGHGDLLLRIVASEVCGTDVHLHRGRLAGVPYPIIPGHVSVGEIVETRGVDTDATGRPLAPGDIVTFYDVWGTCHRCYYCAVAEQSNLCPSRKVYGITFGVDDGLHGGWAEAIHLREGTAVFTLPEELTSDDVIGGGCGLFTGFGSVERASIRPGDCVVVQGSGPVGLSAAAFSRLGGCGALFVIGDPAPRLDLARRRGAAVVLSRTTRPAGQSHEAVRRGTARRRAGRVIGG
ncbi:MAG: alcohol dehydrogenase catalytic domain-containing protein, partial [Gemmatimonadota bacterium]|nr:alcohol dehydrogenase catalytic domain-containing protein [Gemmatimonadota bacterium]